jgi:hypothetical protein
MFLITFRIPSTSYSSPRSFLAAAYYGTSLYPTRIKLSHFGLIDSTVKGEWKTKRKGADRDKEKFIQLISIPSIVCVTLRESEKKGEKFHRKI